MKEIKKGCLVKMIKKSRSKSAPPENGKYIVFWMGYDKYGNYKIGVKDKNDRKFYAQESFFKVIEEDPEALGFDLGFIPLIGVVKKKSKNAAFIRTTSSIEFWVPFSQSRGLEASELGKAISFEIKEWLAIKKGVIKGERK